MHETTDNFKIEATYRDGLDCSTPEVLGEYYGVFFATEGAARMVADRLQGEAASYELDPTTRYHVVAVEGGL